MRILTLKQASGKEFLGVVDPTSKAVFYRTRQALSPGEQVLLEIFFSELPHRELLRGHVARSDEKKSGYWLDIEDEDRQARDHVLAVAQGNVDAAWTVPRKHVRLPVELPVDWNEPGSDQQFVSKIEDIGAGGAFVRTPMPLPAGSEVALVITNGDNAITVPGVVAWVRDREGAPGMGIRFLRATAGDTKRLRELLRRMQERGKTDLK